MSCSLRLAALAVSLPLACAPDPMAAPPVGATPVGAPPELSDQQVVDSEVRERLAELVLAVRASPADADAREKLARSYQANGLPDLAEATYAQALALDPRRPHAWYLRGVALADLGDLEGACAAEARAAELAPDSALPRWRRGLWLLDLGRLEEARDELDEACELDPGDFRPRAALARAELYSDDAAQAVEDARAALALEPNDGPTRHLLATALDELGETEAAARERALAALAPPLPLDAWLAEMKEEELGPLYHLALARQLLDQRGPLQARAEIEALLAERPDYPAVLRLADDMYVGLGTPETGLALLEAARARVPDHPDIALFLGAALMRAGEVERALNETAAAVRLNPGLGPARHQLGSFQNSAGLYEEARLSFGEALARGYREGSMLVELGVVQRRTGREIEAVASFEEACAKLPDSFEAHLFLARARGEIGDLPGAWAAYKRAAELQGSSPALAQVADRLRDLEAGAEHAPR
jgi:tetratricopeptide (TPR) repeat protein